MDWPKVRVGDKTEFRTRGGNVRSYPDLPMLVVGTAPRSPSQLLVLEDTWQEELGAISIESLAREGFDSLGLYREYWRGRGRRGYRAMDMVHVFRVHPFSDLDRMTMAEALLERFYGEWL